MPRGGSIEAPFGDSFSIFYLDLGNVYCKCQSIEYLSCQTLWEVQHSWAALTFRVVAQRVRVPARWTNELAQRWTNLKTPPIIVHLRKSVQVGCYLSQKSQRDNMPTVVVLPAKVIQPIVTEVWALSILSRENKHRLESNVTTKSLLLTIQETIQRTETTVGESNQLWWGSYGYAQEFHKENFTSKAKP